MDAQIDEIAKSFHVLYKIYITSEENIISCVANLLGDKVISIVEGSIFDNKPSKNFFYTKDRNPIYVKHNGQNIGIVTFYHQGYWRMILGSMSMETITSFLESFKKPKVMEGYIEYRGSYSGYDYSNGRNITTGLTFDDLIGVNIFRDEILDDIHKYFENISTYRTLGVNKGLNYVIYGSPGTGKSSFVRALALKLHANLFIANCRSMSGRDIDLMLNPTMKGTSVVLLDDFKASEGSMNDYIHAMFDNGAENVIRIFITNNFGNINHTPFISRCRRIMNFTAPSIDNMVTLICKAFKVDTKDANQLAQAIEAKETERLKAYNARKAQLELENEGNKPIKMNPFEPMGYRDINYFISEFIGCEDPIQKCILKVNKWADEHGKHIDASNSGSHEKCTIM